MASLQSVSGRPAGRCEAARFSAAIRPRVGLVARATAANDAADAPSTSRRSTLMLASSLLLLSSATPGTAQATTTTKDPINRYVKRKRLDPLASYVPALLLAREQLVASAAFFAEGDATSARALLRSGAFRGVRESVRAVGEYATEAGQPGSDLVAAFLRELEAFDARMRVAERAQEKKGDDESGGSAENTENNKGAEEAAVAALDALVATVPSETVERARQVVASAVEGAAPAAAAPAAGRGGGSADPALIEGLLAAE